MDGIIGLVVIGLVVYYGYKLLKKMTSSTFDFIKNIIISIFNLIKMIVMIPIKIILFIYKIIKPTKKTYPTSSGSRGNSNWKCPKCGNFGMHFIGNGAVGQCKFCYYTN